MSSRSSDILFLLGAGASVDAGIPASATMIREIETLLNNNHEWKSFHDLYNHVKSSIHFSAGLKGRFNDAVLFNVETLANALYELERNEEHTLYPFIAAWHSRFATLAGPRFEQITRFRKLILGQLKKWMCPDLITSSEYYQGLTRLQADLNYSLHIFSLNYDLCVERLGTNGFRVESGFPGYGTDMTWDWERFEQGGERTDLPNIYLYKIHGSVDWKRDLNQSLYRVEQVATVDTDNMEIIFGRDFKLDAADPYLFYAYEFRRFALSARMIVTIGYSFSDDHINKMIAQALRANAERKLLVVGKYDTENQCEKRRKELSKSLAIHLNRVVVFKGSAKSFFEQESINTYLNDALPAPVDSPF
jgi:hypothetical protein